MKKITVFFVSLSLLILQGCNNQSAETPIETKPAQEKAAKTEKQPGMIESVANYYSPKKNFDKANNAKRQTELATLLNAFVYTNGMGGLACKKGGTSDAAKIPVCDNPALNGSLFDGAVELGTGTGKLDCAESLSSMLAKVPVNPGPGNTEANTGYWVCQSQNRIYVLTGGGVVNEKGGCFYPGNPENYPEEITKEDRVMCVSG